MHGAGNDYIYFDGHSEDLTAYDLTELAKLVSDRHFGVGGDGIILVLPSEAADFRMRIFNPDGSEAEMCGNGIRAFARYVYEHGLTGKTDMLVQTGAGLIRPILKVERGRVVSVRVDMGEPRLARSEIPMTGRPANKPVIGEVLEVDGRSLQVTCVSMGNPHCVSFVEDVEEAPVAELGPLVENHAAFPARTNVEFVQVLDRGNVRMRVWERGAGETLACGTGASASQVACVLNELTERSAEVHLRGGVLGIEWAEDNHVYMTGPGAEVFTGELSEELLARARV
jgi:diaminopimelate epimerase